MLYALQLWFLVTVLAITTPWTVNGRRRHCKRPNIVFFLVDDMGWNDVGYHNMTQIPTPNIDTLAYNSIILNNYYTHPACSPSRSALLSGKYATTTGLQHEVLQDPQPVGLPLDLKTLPQTLRRLGYTTSMIGKWHLGFHDKHYTPNYRGFDNFYGFWGGDTDLFYHVTVANRTRSDLYGIPCYETRDKIIVEGLSSRHNLKTVNNVGQYLTYVYTDRAKQVIRRHNKRKPLFLYLSHHGVHRGNSFLPIRAPEQLVNLFDNIKNPGRANFSGALTAIDLSLGEVMEALDRRHMLEDTIIVFSSDNGSPLPGSVENGGSNYPLRGGKVTGWEGGVRTNAYVWNNKFKYTGLYNGLMHIVDWMPTLYTAAGGKKDIVSQYGLDAKDMWDAIRDNSPSPRQNMVLQNDSIYNYAVYRSGDFKLIMGKIPEDFSDSYYGDPGREPPPKDVPTTGSKTERVLRKFYGSIGKEFRANGTPIQVECLDQSMNIDCVSSPDMICLYNITADPCEQRNLAKLQPDVVARLQVEFRRIQGVPPNYPMGDYACNPVFYKGYWAPWTNTDYNYNSTSC